MPDVLAYLAPLSTLDGTQWIGIVGAVTAVAATISAVFLGGVWWGRR